MCGKGVVEGTMRGGRWGRKEEGGEVVEERKGKK